MANTQHKYSVLLGSETLLLKNELSLHQASIYVALDDAQMIQFFEHVRFFMPKVEVLLFPAWDCIPYDRISPTASILSKRMQTLSRLSSRNWNSDKPCIVVTTINALIQKVPPIAHIKNASFVGQIGDVIDREKLAMFLVQNGYVNNPTATEGGEFAIRGSIMDIVPAGEEQGYRLDFFDSELESIRIFDPLTQITQGKTSRIELVPASEVLFNDETIQQFRHNYRLHFGSTLKGDPFYEAISAGRKYTGQEHWLPLFYDQLVPLMAYMPNPYITFSHLSDESHKVREEMIKDSFAARKEFEHNEELNASIYHPLPPEMLYLTDDQWGAALADLNTLHLHHYDSEGYEKDFEACPAYDMLSRCEKKSAFELMARDIASRDQTAILACSSTGSRSRIVRMLDQHEQGYNEISTLKEVKTDTVNVAVLPLEHGFITPHYQLISEADLLGEKIQPARRKRKKVENFLEEASLMEEGDLLVHRDHGLGRFKGLETITVLGESHDFLLLSYADDDKLYVPVENIDLLSRYGGDSESASLDHLSSLSWQKRAAAVKKRIKVTAEELIAIAAKRVLRKAPAFIPKTGLYDEFCSRFPYAETDDQLNAIEDVLEDLSSGQPMDRLICGDVGFGKTEIALRAAAAVAFSEEHKNDISPPQIALIAPTTLLVRQHIETFRKRFAHMPVKVAELSRMVSTKTMRETKQAIRDGEINIVIGTHALLSKDIEFANLSLVMVDEEQRFGVKQKERLKQLRANTHILTMTATPIPRTLQLSMTGIRDLSLITTPPVDRLAIRTFVMPYDGVVLREAMLREYYRGGRVFYICPRIKDVEEMESKIKALVPEMKVVAAHGQMNPDELDDIMTSFYEGKYDVLLATTIIESGIDIPEANTLIVHRADRYGLAQLYQIRGRVGRSKVRAYAYMTLQPHVIPTKQAQKRLEVLQKLDTLGAGFTLASHDMDIRGFGNLLGDEQSGHVREVGVELYQSMLQDAIVALKAGDKLDDIEVSENQHHSPKISLSVSALIPESYIEDVSLRLSLYRRIGHLSSDQEIEAMAIEMMDRFGPVPQEVENLFESMKLKLLCLKANIAKLDVGQKGASIHFYDQTFANPDGLIQLVMKNPLEMKINGKDQSITVMNQNWSNAKKRIEGIRFYLNMLIKLLED